MAAPVTEDEPIEDDSNKDLQTKKPMLEFERQIFIDIYEKDGLVCLAKGINYNTILLNLLWLYNDPANLVLVLNSNEHEEKYFNKELNLRSLPALSTDREKIYLEGGIYFTSTRILVVDLLKNRLPIEHITGIIVLRAHSILESCQEAFALRLYRQKNKTGFIKAFSNSPISFTFGYGHVEKVMRSLFVTELYLWPRFHGTVIKTLQKRQANVLELHVPLTANATQIQTCLLDLMNYTTKSLKLSNKTLEMQEITLENCITKKFHKILQSQLDTVWHQIGTRSKEFIQDLKVLRSLIINLIHQDSVSFYALVRQYRTPEYAQINSGWILLDSAEMLFKLAKGRVFNSKNEFDPEACQKWQCLKDVLMTDIPEDLKKNKSDSNDSKRANILVLCQDNRTCAQLNQYLVMGTYKYLLYTAFKNDLQVNAIVSKFDDYKEDFEKLTQDKVSQVKKDSKKKEEAEKDDSGEFEEEVGINALNRSNYVLTMTQMDTTGSQSAANTTIFEPFTQMETMDITSVVSEKPFICIQTFKENGNHFSLERTLQTLRPEYIVMYHSDVSAIRQIEIYESRKEPSEPVTTVYFIIHAKTVEEQAYLTSLKREKEAFELLIQTKSVMVLPTYQDGKTDDCFNLNVVEQEDPLESRRAGGQKINEKPRVIVDMREFRSDLPSLLHKRGIEIDPVTITVGDYILTPEICVERKSISDLIGSLNSGRLYTQCTQMTRNYTRAILLIEFDQNKQFNFQGQFITSSDMAGSDIQQKLQLLTIHFPRLKLVWSPSPYATAELFYELKQGRKNPDVSESMALGGDIVAEDITFERYNVAVHDFVQKLPGITSKNIARIMNKGVSLDNLASLNKADLLKIIENKSDTDMLWSIIHVPCKPSDASGKDEKQFKRKFTSKIFKGKK